MIVWVDSASLLLPLKAFSKLFSTYIGHAHPLSSFSGWHSATFITLLRLQDRAWLRYPIDWTGWGAGLSDLHGWDGWAWLGRCNASGHVCSDVHQCITVKTHAHAKTHHVHWGHHGDQCLRWFGRTHPYIFGTYSLTVNLPVTAMYTWK